MGSSVKVVFVGAGSMSFGMSVFRDYFRSDVLKGTTLTLVDTFEQNLNSMYDLAVHLNETVKFNMKIEKTTDLRQALQGADFVINSIAVDRTRLWKLDFEIPKKYGIRHCLGENGGIGGLFFTMRTIPVIMDMIRLMEEICPHAYFINFSNPENRIIHAVGRTSPIKCMGLCHGIVSGIRGVATILECDEGSIDVFSAGLNHMQWFLQIRDKDSGKDLYPLFIEKEATFDKTYRPFSRKLFKTFGYFPSPSDNHIGEYFSYGWEAGEVGYDFIRDNNRRISMKETVEGLLNKSIAVEEFLVPSGEHAVNTIVAIATHKQTVIPSGIVYNNGIITNVPDDAAVEVPVMLDGNGIHPFYVGNLPSNIGRLCTHQALVQQACVDAALLGSKELAFQALLMDPIIHDTDKAKQAFDELWEYNKIYVRASR